MHPIVLLAIVLIMFGPGKLTETMGQLGKGVREFREMSSAEPQAALPEPTRRDS